MKLEEILHPKGRKGKRNEGKLGQVEKIYQDGIFKFIHINYHIKY